MTAPPIAPQTRTLLISGVALVLILVAVAHITGAADTSIVSNVKKAAS